MKRKAEEDAEDDRDKNREDDQEIPMPEAVPTTTTTTGATGADATKSTSSSSGATPEMGGTKRGREDLEETRTATRMRLNLLVQDVHGGGEDEESQVFAVNKTSEKYPIKFDVGGVEWSDFLENENGQWEPMAGCEDVEKKFSSELVDAAKLTEYKTLMERGTYKVVDRATMHNDPEAVRVSTKWVLTNKGTEASPHIKARFVAREFVSKAIDRD